MNHVLIALDSSNTVIDDLASHLACHVGVSSSESSIIDDPACHVGDHVVAVWLDDDGTKENWDLGVVDCFDGQNLIVAYFIRSDARSARSWIFPEESQLVSTATSQIIAKGMQVSYQCSTRIRCEVTNKELSKELDNIVNERNSLM